MMIIVAVTSKETRHVMKKEKKIVSDLVRMKIKMYETAFSIEFFFLNKISLYISLYFLSRLINYWWFIFSMYFFRDPNPLSFDMFFYEIFNRWKVFYVFKLEIKSDKNCVPIHRTTKNFTRLKIRFLIMNPT